MNKRYLASLPERTLRAGAAVVGGVAYETTELLLPASIRQSKLYQTTIARLLQLTIELVGGVDGVYSSAAMTPKELLARKTAGNVVEWMSLATLGWSPLWLLAAASDLSGGTKQYLQVLVGELQAARLLPADIEFTSVSDLLAALEQGSGVMADTIDVPPLALTELRESLSRMQQHVAELPPAGELTALFEQLQATARKEERSLLEVSAIVAVGAARAGATLGNRYILDYYRSAFATIAREGVFRYGQRISRPYRRSIARHFDPEQQTYSERLLQRWRGPHNK